MPAATEQPDDAEWLSGPSSGLVRTRPMSAVQGSVLLSEPSSETVGPRPIATRTSVSGQGHADMFSVDSFGNARQLTSFDAERPSSWSCGDDNVSVSSHCATSSVSRWGRPVATSRIEASSGMPKPLARDRRRRFCAGGQK